MHSVVPVVPEYYAMYYCYTTEKFAYTYLATMHNTLSMITLWCITIMPRKLFVLIHACLCLVQNN